MEPIGYINTPPSLDGVFAALADPTRRSILKRLTTGEKSVGELAQPFAISQPAISRHLKVLERAGLVERTIAGTQRPARLRAAPMAEAVHWLENFRSFWAGSFDQLDGLLEEMKQTDSNGDHDD